MYRGCERGKVVFMNATSDNFIVTLSPTANTEDVLFQGVIEFDSPPLEVGVNINYAETAYLVKAENIKTKETISGEFGYIFPNHFDKQFFMFTGKKIHYNSWVMFGFHGSDSDNQFIPLVKYAFYSLFNETSCVFD